MFDFIKKINEEAEFRAQLNKRLKECQSIVEQETKRVSEHRRLRAVKGRVV